jgi:hypothetical protein
MPPRGHRRIHRPTRCPFVVLRHPGPHFPQWSEKYPACGACPSAAKSVYASRMAESRFN